MNERVEDGVGRPPLQFLCECANPHCHAPLDLAVDEYEEIRTIPTHFAILPGHEWPELERVVEESSRFVVVEKFGDAGIAAVRLDPRRRHHAAEVTDQQ